jgi:hypothetical protein
MTYQQDATVNKPLFIFMVLSIAGIIFMFSYSLRVCMTMIVVMLPTVFAMLLDRSRDKCMSFSIFFFNISAVLIDSMGLMFNQGVVLSNQIVKNAYLSAVTGFVFYLVVPITIRSFYTQISSFKRARARSKIKQLESLWDVTY